MNPRRLGCPEALTVCPFWSLLQAGLSAIIDGLSKVLRDDRKLFQQTSVVFDGLHALLSKRSARPRTEKGRGAKGKRK